MTRGRSPETILFGANLLAAAAPLAGLPLLSRLYAPTSYGLFSSTLVVATMASLLLVWSRDLSITVIPREAVGSSIRYVVKLLALAGAAASVVGAAVWPRTTVAGQVIVGAGAVIMGLGVQRLLNFYALRMRNYAAVAVGRVTLSVGIVMLQAILALLLPRNASTLLVGAGAAGGFSALAIFLVTRGAKDRVNHDENIHQGEPSTLRAPGRTAFAAAVSTASVAVPLLALGVAGKHDAAGTFSIAQRIQQAPVGIFILPLGQILAAEFGAALRTGRATASDHHFSNTLKKGMVIGAANAAALALFSLVAPTVLGDEWAGVSPMLLALIPALIAQSTFSPLTQMLPLAGGGSALMTWELSRCIVPFLTLWILLSGQLEPVAAVWVYSLFSTLAYAALLPMIRSALARDQQSVQGPGERRASLPNDASTKPEDLRCR